MDIRIDRCVLHGGEGDVRRAQRVLMNCPWPPVGEAEMLILRRIEVRAPPERLPTRLYEAADALMSHPVDGWSEAAVGADCVRFRSEADMLARLSLDLATGRAADLWFWQSFRHYWSAPPARALAALWLDETSRLPAVTRVLRERGRLPAVWRRLDESAARALLPCLVGTAAAGQLQRGRPHRAASDAPRERLPALTPAPAPPPPVLAKLIEALADFEVQPDERDRLTGTRDRLALALGVAAAYPHWIAAPDAGPRLLALIDALTGRAPPRPSPGRPSPPPNLPPVRSPRQPPSHAGAAQGSARPTGVERAPGPRSETDLMRAAASDGERHRGAEPPSPVARSRAAPEPPPMPGTGDGIGRTPADATDTWKVSQGGLFYLLNLLNWRPVRERLFADAEAMAFPSGWGWLYRLGETLDLEPEPPLTHCLARLSGLPDVRFPADLPPLPVAAGIAALGAERYARFGIWQPRLLQVPARVRYRRPELDIHYAMADLDIAVRSAALDVDPGWIDWLGTVVRFHYS